MSCHKKSFVSMIMKTSFYTSEELRELGFRKLGENVLISKKISIYSPENISIGNNVRIDDFCILSGKIKLGNFIHIAAGCYLFGGTDGIEIEDFSTLSSRVAIYALTDDFSGKVLTNPMVPEKYRNVIHGKVKLGRHVIIGTGTTILPNITIGEGVAIGAMSLVLKDVTEWSIAVGIPAEVVKRREKNLLELESKFLSEFLGGGNL